MFRLIVIAALVASAVPAQAQSGGRRSWSLKPAEVGAIRDGVRNGLLSPSTARFGRMVARKERPGVAKVCGYVNTTNGSGVYIGNRVFAGTLTIPPASQGIVFVERQHVVLSDAVATCRQWGIA